MKIINIFFGYVMNLLQIDRAVLVGNEVSQPHRLDNLFCKFGFQQAVLLQHIEHFIAAAWNAVSFFTYNVSGDIDAVLDGHLHIE